MYVQKKLIINNLKLWLQIIYNHSFQSIDNLNGGEITYNILSPINNE